MGHIVKLGTPDALRNYSAKPQGDGIAWTRGPANPFGVKINASGQYDKIDAWNEWVQEDWQTGVGRVDPQGGGFLYAEAETRVPNQIILPPLLQQCDLRTIDGTTSDCRYMPNSVAGTYTLGNSGNYYRLAAAFTTPNPYSVGISQINPCVYAQIPEGVSVTIAIHGNSGGSPGVPIVSGVVTGEAPGNSFQWYGLTLSNSGLSAGTQYWLAIYPTDGADTIQVAYGAADYDTDSKGFAGSSWSTLTSKYMLYTTDVFRIPFNAKLNSFYIRFNSVLYFTTEGYLYKYDSTNEQFDSVGTVTGSGDITSVAVFGPSLFFGRSSGNYTTMNTSETFSAASTTRKLFLEHSGYLYGTWQNDLYYSTDGSTWSSAFQVGGDDAEIRGIAGMGADLYMATDKALYRFAPGQVIEEVARFGTEDTTNGKGMIEYQGRLYIPVGGRLLRFDPSGQLIDVWMSKADDLVSGRIGTISHLTRMNNWLVAFVVPVTAGGRPTLWLFQEEGWHYIASAVSIETSLILPTEQQGIYYDRGSSRLWFSYAGLYSLFVHIDDYTLNPYNSTTYLYQPYGWLEQDKFYGGQYLLNKAFDGVTIVADNLSATTFVKVYWQDENSAEWEFLGTATVDGQELRWPFSTRPLGKWIKLGLLLQTNSGTETPRVRAVIVKNLPRTQNRRRDTINLTLKDYIEMPDGVPDAYTLIEQLTHIEQMIEIVGPFVYQDPIGRQYEVLIVDHNFGMPRFDYYGGQNRVKELDVTLVLEQLPEGTYSAQPIGLLLALTRSFV